MQRQGITKATLAERTHTSRAQVHRIRPFARDLPLTASLAFPGVVLAAAFVATGIHLIIGWSWTGAALFGVLIAATDPVAVIAAFKEMRVDRRLSKTVETESLLNDGAAAVGFTLLGAMAAGAAMGPAAIAWSLAWTVVGGVAVGLAVTAPLLLLAWLSNDIKNPSGGDTENPSTLLL